MLDHEGKLYDIAAIKFNPKQFCWFVSDLYFLIAACAAANLATGTLNGEQLT